MHVGQNERVRHWPDWLGRTWATHWPSAGWVQQQVSSKSSNGSIVMALYDIYYIDMRMCSLTRRALTEERGKPRLLRVFNWFCSKMLECISRFQ